MTTVLRKLTKISHIFFYKVFYSYILWNIHSILGPSAKELLKNFYVNIFLRAECSVLPKVLDWSTFSRTSLIIFSTGEPRRIHCRKCRNGELFFFKLDCFLLLIKLHLQKIQKSPIFCICFFFSTSCIK